MGGFSTESTQRIEVYSDKIDNELTFKYYDNHKHKCLDHEANCNCTTSITDCGISIPEGHKSLQSDAIRWANTFLSSTAFIVLTCILLFLGRDYLKRVLMWLEHQDKWIVILIFIVLFTLVSLPLTWGYILLNLTCGYLFGLLNGVLVVFVAAAIGVAIAHVFIQTFMKRFVLNRLINNDNIRATLAVVGGPQAFKVIAFTRLTPIPFGLQNAVFAMSPVPYGKYMLATMAGLLPTQVINTYLGSTVRSMEDVLMDSATATTGWIVFVVQIGISLALMIYVIHLARTELLLAIPQGYFDLKNPIEPPSINGMKRGCFVANSSVQPKYDYHNVLMCDNLNSLDCESMNNNSVEQLIVNGGAN